MWNTPYYGGPTVRRHGARADGTEAPAQDLAEPPAEATGEGRREESALERIVKDEHGTPLFESTDAETAWDALVEDSEDEAEAEEYATGMSKVLERDVEMTRERVANVMVTGDRAKNKADKKAARKELAEAEKRLEHWRAMLDVKGRREEEARVAAEVEKRNQAAERAERERTESGERASERGGRAGAVEDVEREYIAPVGRGKFGEIFAAFRGKAKEAWRYQSARKSGQARGVFYRPEIGEIDLVWGDASTPYSGKGLAHIDRKHVKTLGDF